MKNLLTLALISFLSSSATSFAHDSCKKPRSIHEAEIVSGEGQEGSEASTSDASDRDEAIRGFKESMLFAESGGMNGAGNGDFIMGKNNPLYMNAPEGIVWCIDHGGTDKFSLPKEKAAKQIEESLNRILSQIKLMKETGVGGRNYNGIIIDNGFYPVPPQLDQVGLRSTYSGGPNRVTDVKTYTSKQTRVNDCQKANLVIVLGNDTNPYISEILKKGSVEAFRKAAGFAVKTQFDPSKLTGKGLVYLAADKGRFAYTGPRSIHYRLTDTIWDIGEYITKKTPFPPHVVHGHIKLEKNLKVSSFNFKEQYVGPLAPIFAHEFSHLLGIGHVLGDETKKSDVYSNNPFLNEYHLMHKDYPATVIRNGGVFKGQYEQAIAFLLRGTGSRTLSTGWRFFVGGKSPNIDQMREFLLGFKGQVKELFEQVFAEENISGLSVYLDKDGDFKNPRDEFSGKVPMIQDTRMSLRFLDHNPTRKIHFYGINKTTNTHKLINSYEVSNTNCPKVFRSTYKARQGQVVARSYREFKYEIGGVDDIGSFSFNSEGGKWEKKERGPFSLEKETLVLELNSDQECLTIHMGQVDIKLTISKNLSGNTDEMVFHVDTSDDWRIPSYHSVPLRGQNLGGFQVESFEEKPPVFTPILRLR